MKIRFKKLQLRANRIYEGVIKEIEFDEENNRVRIFTELDKVKGEIFYKSLPYSESEASQLGQFFENMGAIDEEGIVDFEELKGQAVQVTLNQGKNSTWYVNEMYLIEEYEEADDEDIFGDGE